MWPDEFASRYRELGYWRGETFGGLLREWAGRWGERTAVIDGETHLSYAELDRRADRLAAGLHGIGVRAGDRVVLQLPSTAAFFDVIFALFRLGALPVFALPSHRANEIGYFCAHSEAVALVTTDVLDGFDHRSLAAVAGNARVIIAGDPGEHTALADLYTDPIPLPERDPGELAFLQLSGGSTGRPKLIPRTHDDYLYSVWASADICGLSTETVYLCALPVAHNYPLSSPGVLGVLYAGGTVVLCPRPDPATAFALIERHRVTITGVVPPIALVWLESARRSTRDLSSLQVLQVGGAKLAEEVARRVRPTLGCTLQQVFGMAEGLVNYTRLDDPEEVVVSTQGRPISAHDEVLVLDEDGNPVPDGETGHLLTRGPYTIRGYWRAEEHNARAFTPDGFYRTGDIVRRDSDGYLVVTGRAKDQINRGGEKIAAEEVENELLAHPAVHDAAVVAMPDRYLGERSCAFVVLRQGVPVPAANTLREFVRDRGLAAYKVPDRVEFLDEFPTTAVGKTSTNDLRAALRARLERG
ncbi:(2,3-dihydroxybenzoyl)adenylate synthase [Crossiella cryophila]|uniref:2,3-dihydroxybenzoate-AMP ligase n=1 Tax=Crossiella cryophila TaxID=43355 RepID=A0A7W7CF94_9PSEU|nr:(2,3-dihydroxybenzoyl)adenylate synthase [Crossiella cryophila]MBB4680025.1 2,3-dihydroxybenzoate-AMP ligase [Crossiella cryophila]